MKKLFKRLMALSLCACMMVGMTVSASAATYQTYATSPYNATHWRNGGNSSGYMNAYATTASNITNGTKVTQYTFVNDSTQEFYVSSNYLKNASRSDLVVKKLFTENSDQEVKLSSNTTDARVSVAAVSDAYTITLNTTGEKLAGRSTNNTSQTLWFDYAYEFTPYIYWYLE